VIARGREAAVHAFRSDNPPFYGGIWRRASMAGASRSRRTVLPFRGPNRPGSPSASTWT